MRRGPVFSDAKLLTMLRNRLVKNQNFLPMVVSDMTEIYQRSFPVSEPVEKLHIVIDGAKTLISPQQLLYREQFYGVMNFAEVMAQRVPEQPVYFMMAQFAENFSRQDGFRPTSRLLLGLADAALDKFNQNTATLEMLEPKDLCDIDICNEQLMLFGAGTAYTQAFQKANDRFHLI